VLRSVYTAGYEGHPVHERMCGNVIHGRANPEFTFEYMESCLGVKYVYKGDT
jgi:hypothetical protein